MYRMVYPGSVYPGHGREAVYPPWVPGHIHQEVYPHPTIAQGTPLIPYIAQVHLSYLRVVYAHHAARGGVPPTMGRGRHIRAEGQQPWEEGSTLRIVVTPQPWER